MSYSRHVTYTLLILLMLFFFFFFFNDTATTEIYTLSLHDALPIYMLRSLRTAGRGLSTSCHPKPFALTWKIPLDRKSTRLNSSHGYISYAVFCLKKKKKQHSSHTTLTS